jgi:hypothetical protein
MHADLPHIIQENAHEHNHSEGRHDAKTGARVTGEPGLVGTRVILRLLAVGREVRTMVRSPTPAPHVSVIGAERDDDAGSLDDVAGCEFVDDRIHLLD